MADDAKARLIAIVRQRSFSTGSDTRLVSGRSTSFYFDMKPSMLHPEGIHLMAALVLDALEGARVDLVGGLEMGAVPLAVAVAMASHGRGRPLGAVFVRKQAKDHGTKSLVEGELKSGDRVIIIEDVVTTGGSSLQAIAAVKALGCDVRRVFAMVDREEGGRDALAAEGCRLEAVFTAKELLAAAK